MTTLINENRLSGASKVIDGTMSKAATSTGRVAKTQSATPDPSLPATDNAVFQTPKPTLTDVQQSYRDAMCHLAAAVNIITTEGCAGKAGFTASAVCSVSDSPPTLLVCLNRGASVYPTFKANQVLCVNTLGINHKDISSTFGGKTLMEERFKEGSWTTLVTGSPVLQDAVISFDCDVKQVTSAGTHDIFICEVLALKHNPATDSLMYFNRNYHQLSKYTS